MNEVLQANVNNSKSFLDLLIHHAKELGVSMLLVSEPNVIPGSNNWFASANGKAAIFCDLNLIRIKCRLAKQGRRYVAVYCGPYLMVSVYVSPSLDLRDFNTTLDKLSDVFSRVDKLIIGGDFNAKSCLWGSQLTDGNPYLTTCSQVGQRRRTFESPMSEIDRCSTPGVLNRGCYLDISGSPSNCQKLACGGG